MGREREGREGRRGKERWEDLEMGEKSYGGRRDRKKSDGETERG